MSVEISWNNSKKSIDVEEGATVQDIFEEIDVNPETVIIELDERVVSLEEELNGDEDIRLINVVSGG